ncbi:hypothetical protein EYF80_012863 [Liparis tanakae]|uniref:Secreted protein n=1 Tax=Liparis tanakae TaxID=230148 RepID=A0A4Z2IFW9_9TELE|nr:hypothetical protein EYF80_012863 [Liparis tanakae]
MVMVMVMVVMLPKAVKGRLWVTGLNNLPFPNDYSARHLYSIKPNTHAQALFHESCFPGPLALTTPPSHTCQKP